nr:M60 family metallopeptidase [Clostridia bacterium]
MKLKTKVVKIFGVILAAVMSASVVTLSACKKQTDNAFTIPQTQLPTEEQFALKQYDYDSLSHVQTTVRADVKNVLERNLPRAKTEYLSDDFSIVYNTETKELTTAYELVASTATKKTATISFDKYPAPNLKDNGMLNAESVGYGTTVSCNGFNAFSNGTMNGQTVSSEKPAGSEDSYNTFYKYMLITQGQHLAAEAAERSKNGTLTQEWLKKHPAADAQYGAVLGENNAVKKEITLDPIYRSYHDTGLYLPAGEAVTVKVEGLKAGERISVVLGVQDSLAWRGGADDAAFNAIAGNYNSVKAISSDAYFTKADVLVANNKLDKISLQGQWGRQNERLPWLHAEFTFTENKEYTIGTPFGGLIEINMGNCYSRVKTTITGAVEAPHYVLGQTTPDDFDKYLREAPGVIGVLDTENGQLIGPTGEIGSTKFMRQVKTDEVDKLAMLWHSFLSVNESFTGGTYNRFNKIMFDWHVPAGAAVALGNYSFAQPTGWFNEAMNYRALLRSGTWGTLHEIGHNHSSAYGVVWGFGCDSEGEVRNNALNLLSYIMLCDVGTTIRSGGGSEHGEYANPYNTLSETLNKKGNYSDASSCGYFEILGMYANIMHSFGADKFYELLYTYKDKPSYCSNKRADFAYRCAIVNGMNFVKYFNDFYSAKISDDMFTEEQLAEMQALPNYEPVSCFYAGGIDGVKTAGDYIVAFGEDVIFDLLTNTISTLDTSDAKGFTIEKVSQPEHGKIRELGGGKWAYSFDKNYTGTFDNFTFDVKLSDGIVHRLQITLRISYNGARLTSYNDVKGNNFDEIFADVDSKQPDAVVGISTPNINNYQTASGKKDVRIAEFYWKAPVSGEISISAKWDDWAKIYFGDSFSSLEEIISGTHDIGSYKEYNVTKTVEKGKFYAVKIFNVNTGGGGSASLAVKNEAGTYVQLNSADIFHPDFPLGQTAPAYTYEPQFLVSKKDNIKLSSTGTDKAQWKVVSAPENVNAGRYENVNMTDETTGEVTVFQTDKWNWLIDGQTNTIFHTAWQ